MQATFSLWEMGHYLRFAIGVEEDMDGQLHGGIKLLNIMMISLSIL